MIIVNLNRKGGVGKTTNTIHIAAVLASKGAKVLLVDADSQCDLSGGCNIRNEKLLDSFNIVDLLEGNPKGKEEVLIQVDENMFVLTGSQNFDAQNYKKNALKKALDPIKDAFDFVFIDVPPAGIVATSTTPAELALFACDYYMCTLYPDYFSSKNLNDFLQSVEELKEKNKLSLQLIGAYFSNVNPQTIMYKNLAELMNTNAEGAFFKTFIRRSENVVKASWEGKTIFQYDHNCTVAQDYLNLTNEMLKKLGIEDEEWK